MNYCNERGLNVLLYDPGLDNYELRDLNSGKYNTLVISHVLEHMTEPGNVLKSLMQACTRLGVSRILVIVPCKAGFTYDPTHITYVSKEFLEKNDLLKYCGFSLKKWGYFPFNLKSAGDFFIFNEFYALYALS